ncbi:MULTISPECIES: IS4 family transposase [unclassified Streptomyces]|uniref:IS4 family transposase n=1 Tax=unclassified Streptomyces TaxID=2593676 RepID=UPI002252E7E2|nr:MULTISPECIES: IS4 family transposase [unclassified Streptomyces]MCX4554045.1 IS4 family transposase [Streptomyces sp. NBC_01500]WSC18946.1 IS4 family transposase [Streptomyces sp. NBC_01766]
MPRPGQVKSSGERLSDRIALGVLTRVFPPELVDEVVVECGRAEERSRLLPARVVVYFVLAMCLFSGQGYEEVARLLTQGLERVRRWEKPWRVPTTAAIARARRRLGPQPLKALFARVCRPVAAEDTAGAWYRQWRLVAVDGTVFDVPDTEANGGFFGRPGSGRGQQRSAYPQVRVAALVECGTHAVFAAATGPLSRHEQQLIPELLDRLGPGMLVMADRGITGFDLWQEASGTGADLLWRVRKNIVLPVLEHLGDGSYLSQIAATGDRARRDPATVRVIEYTLGPGDDTEYRLITTVRDPVQAPAVELAALYHQRWEIENTLDEIKTHQGGRELVLRSQYPDGVEQEIYGFLLVHHALRDVIHDTAHRAGLDPDRISFTRTLNAARRHVTDQAALSPLTAGTGPHPHQP